MKFGQQAEESVAMFLENQGYKILERNYRTRWAEIDIIASCKSTPNGQDILSIDTLVFIEVKARNSTRYGLPAEAVSLSKQKKIISAALHYIREKKVVDTRIRFDVMTLLFQNGKYQMEIIPNAFYAI
ncbi:MAG: YraN family protein [Desulfamplus sp.]|nr:YraN family protein [Desulfamplus sp.]